VAGQKMNIHVQHQETLPMSDVRYLCLPYCLKRQPDGRWLILNRKYKPLGFTTTAWVEYGAYPIALKLRMTPTLAAQLSHDGQGIKLKPNCDGAGATSPTIHLYNDACSPGLGGAAMQAYLQRLAVLARVKVTC
jgi:hypothetical protein